MEAWHPYDKQKRFIFSQSFYNLFLGGYSSGKSVALCGWVIARALANPGSTGLLGGRTSKDLQGVLMPTLWRLLGQMQEQSGVNWIRSYSKGTSTLTLLNGSQILLRPYNRVQKLAGLNLAYAAFDEVEIAECNSLDLFNVAVGRIREQCNCPGLAFSSTPNGNRNLTRKFIDSQKAYLDAKNLGDAAGMESNGKYFIQTATPLDNPYNPQFFLDALLSANMGKREYAQLVEGKVLTPSNTCLSLEPQHIIPWKWQDHPDLQSAIGVDWGTDCHHYAIYFQILPNGNWIACDEIICDEHSRDQFLDKFFTWVDSHGRKLPALIAPDRAISEMCRATERRYKPLGVHVRWMESLAEQSVQEGLEVLRSALYPAHGDPILYFSDSLTRLVSGKTAGIMPAIEGYCYYLDHDGQPTTRPRKDNSTDHAVDACRMAFRAGADMPHLHNGKKLMVREYARRNEEADKPGNSGQQR